MSKDVPKKRSKVDPKRSGKKGNKKAARSAKTGKFSVEIPPDKPKKGKR